MMPRCVIQFVNFVSIPNTCYRESDLNCAKYLIGSITTAGERERENPANNPPPPAVSITSSPTIVTQNSVPQELADPVLYHL